MRLIVLKIGISRVQSAPIRLRVHAILKMYPTATLFVIVIVLIPVILDSAVKIGFYVL